MVDDQWIFKYKRSHTVYNFFEKWQEESLPPVQFESLVKRFVLVNSSINLMHYVESYHSIFSVYFTFTMCLHMFQSGFLPHTSYSCFSTNTTFSWSLKKIKLACQTRIKYFLFIIGTSSWLNKTSHLPLVENAMTMQCCKKVLSALNQ